MSISKSAADLGKLKAVLPPPEIPADCRTQEAHVNVPKNPQFDVLLAREGEKLNRQNARTMRCNGPGGVIEKLLAIQERAVQ